jgi:multiple sugar transport system permease protein
MSGTRTSGGWKPRRAWRRDLTGYLFASPWLIGLVTLTLLPMVASLLLSFVQWRGVRLEVLRPGMKVETQAQGNYIRWVGLGNYHRALAGVGAGAADDWRALRGWAAGHGLGAAPPVNPAPAAPAGGVLPDKNVWTALKNTAYYSFLSVPLGLTVALLLALLLNQKLRGISLFRTLYYMPHVIGGVATMMMWAWVFNPTFGLLNAFLRQAARPLLWLHLLAPDWQPPQWLYDAHWSKPSLIMMSLWGSGGAMLIFLAALQNVPEQLYEAARIDGASRFRQFLHVTLPQISPAVFFNLVMGVIGSFQVFDTAYIMTGGGPNRSTLFYVLYLYQKGFEDFQLGYASALAWILFVIVLGATLVLVGSSRRWVYYESDGG